MFHRYIALTVLQYSRIPAVWRSEASSSTANRLGGGKGGLYLGEHAGHFIKGFCVLVGIGKETGDLTDGQWRGPSCDGTDRAEGQQRLYTPYC